MRIERLRVREFGPLRDVEMELDAGTNLVFGPNEAGKTTLLDVVLSLLFRWERRRGTRLSTVLGDVERFGDPGEAAGRLELRLDGELLEYPGGPSLLHHLELEHAGLAGLFCVRSGELELPQTEPGEFWDELKKVLAGLPRGVETLKEKVHAEAGLTPTGQLSDAGDPGRKTRLRELRARRRRLEELEETLPDAAEYEERIARLEERKEALERARDARVADLRERRQEVVADREETPRVPEPELQRWRERSRDVRRLEGEVEDLEEELAERRRRAEERREEVTRLEREAAAASEKARAARESGLAERARGWKRDRESAAGDGAAARWRVAGAAKLLAAAAVAAAGSAAGLLPGGLAPALGVSAGLAAAGGAALWRARRLRRRAEDLRRRERELADLAEGLGLGDAEVDELPEAARRLEERASERERERDVARERARSARGRLEETEEELSDRRERLRRASGDVEAAREELGFDSLEEAERARDRRAELDEEIERIESSLAELAGPDPADWEVERPGDEESLPEWDPREWAEVERSLEEARRRYRELQHEFVAAGLSTPEDVLTELRACRSEIRRIEVDREAGLLAGEIFGSMDEALEERIAEALSREGALSVSGLLRRVTGRYVAVARTGESELAVRDEEGREFALEELSRGTRDQIYLALRVGLAEAALEAADGSEPGFLLLDDAFLTADWDRRRRLVAAASELAGEGWQVVYLTCDTHLRELFEETGARVHEL